MKRFFLFLIAAAFVPVLTFGQTNNAQMFPTRQQMEEMRQMQDVGGTINFPLVQQKAQPAENTVGVYYETLPTKTYVQSYLYHQVMKGQLNTAYDPIADVLLLVKQYYGRVPLTATSGDPIGQLIIYRSYDRGKTWDSIIYQTDKSTYFWAPGITIANPYKTKNFDSLFVYMSSYAFIYDPWGNNGLHSVRLFNKQFTTYTSTRSAISDTKWSDTKGIFAMTGNEGSLTMNFLSIGQPDPDNTSIRSDQYAGYLVGGLDAGKLSTQKMNIFPEAWDVYNFYPPEDTVKPGYIYESAIFPATGDDGTAYVIFNNAFPDGKTGRRPSVSKSVDAGKTWSTIDWCPDTTIKQSLAAINPEFRYIWDPFFWWSKPGDDLVAFGPDQLSYIQRVRARFEGPSDSVAFNALIEIRKDGNLWSAIPITNFDRRVHNGEIDGPKEFIGTDWYYTAPGAESYNSAQSYLWRGKDDENNDKDTMITSRRESEVQISKTADGDLVAKWIDFTCQSSKVAYTSDLYGFPKTQLLNSDFEFDSLPKTDIYMAYRKKGEAKWSKSYRIIGDNVMNFTKRSDFYPKKGTSIPKILPSLKQIPLFDLVYDTLKANATTGVMDPRNDYPIALRENGCDYIGSNYIVYHMVNLDTNYTPNPVVEEKPVAKATIGEIFPNPTVSDRIELSLALTNPAFVNVEIFSAIGEKVAVVYNGQVSTQANAIVYNDVKNLQPGAYYCIVTVDGQKTTRKFTVVR